MAKHIDDGGPLIWPVRPPDGKTVALLTEKLKGHATATNWLPAGQWPELDELREEHLRLRDLVASAIASWHDLTAEHAAEDRKHEADLREAYRVGYAPPEKAGTAEDERRARLRGVEERLWAGAVVLAEHVEKVKATLVQHETVWLGGLRGRLATAQEQRREAERLVAEARAAEWRVTQIGQWLQNQCDAEAPFGNQPAPNGTEMAPAMFSESLLEQALDRPYWRAQAPPKTATSVSDVLLLDEPDDGEIVIEPLDEIAGSGGASTATVAPGRNRLSELPRRRKRA